MELQETYTVTQTPRPKYHTMNLTLKEVHLIEKIRQLRNGGKNVMLIIEFLPKFRWRRTYKIEGGE